MRLLGQSGTTTKEGSRMGTKKESPLYLLVDDVARFAVGPVEPYLDSVTVLTDALNRRWVADADARVLIERAQAAWQAELQARSDHDAYLKDRQARRAALAQKIREKMGGGATPESHARVYAAQREALQEFDEREPELDYYRWLERSPMSIA